MALKDLIILMCTTDPPEKRPDCDEILRNEQWSITIGNIDNFGLNDKGIINNDPNDFFGNYFRHKILSFETFDRRFKVIKDIGEGCYGSLLNVEQKINEVKLTIKMIPKSMLSKYTFH